MDRQMPTGSGSLLPASSYRLATGTSFGMSQRPRSATSLGIPTGNARDTFETGHFIHSIFGAPIVPVMCQRRSRFTAAISPERMRR